MRKVWIAGAAVVGVVVGVAEAVNQVATRSAAPPPSGSGLRCGVVVLGYPSRADGSPHLVQRLRVESGVRAARDHDAAVVVMSGGAVRNEHSEAETMVGLAVSLGVEDDRLVAESHSRTTWENIAESAPMVEDCDVVLIASEPLHAARARRYWIKQRPHDAARVFVAVDRRRRFERWWLTTPSAIYELKIAVQDRIRALDD